MSLEKRFCRSALATTGTLPPGGGHSAGSFWEGGGTCCSSHFTPKDRRVDVPAVKTAGHPAQDDADGLNDCVGRGVLGQVGF